MTLGDVLGCVRAVAAFAAVLLAPGYCFAWATDMLGFRARTLGERLAWGVALSFGLMTIASVLVARAASLGAVCWMACLCGLGMLVVLGVEARRGAMSVSGRERLAAGIAAAWVAFVVLEMVDVQVGHHLYMSVTVFDHALRTAFTDAVMRTGVPPVNPLYWPGQDAPMRYYYFWYVLAAAAAKLGRATAREAMIASVVWAGFGLAAALSLYCRHFLAEAGPQHRSRRFGVAMGLCCVTGLDVLPAVFKFILRLPADGDMEWWSSDQVTSWMGTLLWVPHHAAGLVCCLLGFLVVWMSRGQPRGTQGLCAVVAGAAFASAFGLSTWVAIAFALALPAWAMWSLMREQGSRERVAVLVCGALLAVLLLAPYLQELRGGRSGTSAAASAAGAVSPPSDAAHLLRFGVRRIIDPDALLGMPVAARIAKSYPRIEDTVAGLLLLLPGYFVELGLFGLVFVVAVRAMRRGAAMAESTRAAIVLSVAGLLVTTFLRSQIVANNDFGFRSALLPQFFLLLLAVTWSEGGFGVGPRLARTWKAMLWIGAAGTVYQVALLRTYLPLAERSAGSSIAGLSERALAMRVGFSAVDLRIPLTARVQYDTNQPDDFFRIAETLAVGRQVVSAYPGCATPFGGDPATCPAIESEIARLFQQGSAGRSGPAPSSDAAREICSRIGADDLIATRWDKVWQDAEGWVWRLPVVVDTGDMRALDCRAGTR